ncbi:MAG TPA: VOC family protein [Trueperaceae bacterium]
MGYSLDHVQLAMPAGREEQARAFYRDLVGLEELVKPEQLRSRGGVWFSLGAQQLHLGVEEGFRPARKAHPAIRCGDLEELSRRLLDSGFQLEWDANLPGETRFYTHDPFGNRLEFLDTPADL